MTLANRGPRVATAVSLLAAAAAIGAALWALPGRIRADDGAVSVWQSMSSQQRLLREAKVLGIDPGLYVLARRVIPPHATYRTITGPQLKDPSQIGLGGFSTFGQLYLLPRFQTAKLGDAQYVISYGGLLRFGLHLKFTHIWNYKRGMSIGEVAR